MYHTSDCKYAYCSPLKLLNPAHFHQSMKSPGLPGQHMKSEHVPGKKRRPLTLINHKSNAGEFSALGTNFPILELWRESVNT